MRDVLSEIIARDLKRLVTAHGGHNLRVLDLPDATGHSVFLVDMDEGRSLFDLVALTDELSEALGKEVNVLTEASLSPYLRDGLLAKAVAL